MLRAVLVRAYPRPRRFPPRALCVSPASQPASNLNCQFPRWLTASAFQRRGCRSAHSRAVSPDPAGQRLSHSRLPHSRRAAGIAPSFRGIRKPPGSPWQVSSPTAQTRPDIPKSVRRAHPSVRRPLHDGTRFAPGYVFLDQAVFNSILAQASRGHRNLSPSAGPKKSRLGHVRQLSRALHRTRHLPMSVGSADLGGSRHRLSRLRRPRGLQAQAQSAPPT